MAFEQLKSPPLVEAILEVKWRVGPSNQPPATAATTGVWPGPPSEIAIDPSYDLLVGRLSDRLSNSYPFHERLPSAIIPPGIVPFLVQHRFRKGQNAWPVVQVGPGIVTLNDTRNYQWADFLERGITLINTLFETHPQKSEVVMDSLLLRYIDAEPFDFATESALKFLKENLKVTLQLPDSLFQEGQVESRPEGLNLQVVYPSMSPRGVLQLKIATGKRDNQQAIIWETAVLTRGQDVPELPGGTKNWLEAAHGLTHAWFFKLVEGELLRRYSVDEQR